MVINSIKQLTPGQIIKVPLEYSDFIGTNFESPHNCPIHKALTRLLLPEKPTIQVGLDTVHIKSDHHIALHIKDGFRTWDHEKMLSKLKRRRYFSWLFNNPTITLVVHQVKKKLEYF